MSPKSRMSLVFLTFSFLDSDEIGDRGKIDVYRENDEFGFKHVKFMFPLRYLYRDV